MSWQDYFEQEKAMTKARRAARRPLEAMLYQYTSTFSHIINPWHKFLHISRFTDGFEFYVFDGEQSLISTEHSNKNIFSRVYKKGIDQFLKRKGDRFFRRSDKKFRIKVIPETLMHGESAVRYSIEDRTTHYPSKPDDSEFEEKFLEIQETRELEEKIYQPPEEKTLGETLFFLRTELDNHVNKATETRNRSVKIGAVAAGVLTSIFLISNCPKTEKTSMPAKHITLTQNATFSSASPEQSL
jgi:hypothetical protein